MDETRDGKQRLFAASSLWCSYL